MPVKEIAVRFKIHRTTVFEICKRHGTKLRSRSRGMTDEQTRMATRRYAEGASLAKVGAELGLSPSTVRKRLIAAGVQLRPRPGA